MQTNNRWILGRVYRPAQEDGREGKWEKKKEKNELREGSSVEDHDIGERQPSIGPLRSSREVGREKLKPMLVKRKNMMMCTTIQNGGKPVALKRFSSGERLVDQEDRTTYLVFEKRELRVKNTFQQAK